MSLQSVLCINLLPANLWKLLDDTIKKFQEQFRLDLDVTKEVTIWKTMWSRAAFKPETIFQTLKPPVSCAKMFLNIMQVLQLFALSSVSASPAE